jgi:hypothetical protein
LLFGRLKNGQTVDWLLNYRGGSFMMKYDQKLEEECKIRGVSYQVLADAKADEIIDRSKRPICKHGYGEAGESAKNGRVFAKKQTSMG